MCLLIIDSAVWYGMVWSSVLLLLLSAIYYFYYYYLFAIWDIRNNRNKITKKKKITKLLEIVVENKKNKTELNWTEMYAPVKVFNRWKLCWRSNDLCTIPIPTNTTAYVFLLLMLVLLKPLHSQNSLLLYSHTTISTTFLFLYFFFVVFFCCFFFCFWVLIALFSWFFAKQA